MPLRGRRAASGPWRRLLRFASAALAGTAREYLAKAFPGPAVALEYPEKPRKQGRDGVGRAAGEDLLPQAGVAAELPAGEDAAAAGG